MVGNSFAVGLILWSLLGDLYGLPVANAGAGMTGPRLAARCSTIGITLAVTKGCLAALFDGDDEGIFIL